MLIFIDLETTGLESGDKIVSLGIVYEENGETRTIYELINEGKKIPPKASSVHHITNEMIKGKKSFSQSETHRFLQENNGVENVLVAHNVRFDLEKLSSAGLIWKGGIIDTLRVTKHLIPECEFFALQVLRYELKLYKKEEETLCSHHALGDAKTVKSLYENLLELETSEEMQNLTFKNVLLQKLEFGKYEGRYIEDIAANDRGYLEWMLSGIMDLDEDLRYSVNYYLEGNG